MIGHTYLHRIKCQRTFTYYIRGSISIWLTSCLTSLYSAALLTFNQQQITCTVKSKPVKQEVSRKVILPCSLVAIMLVEQL